jgi:exodeoxyribonuclease V alpha subunit
MSRAPLSPLGSVRSWPAGAAAAPTPPWHAELTLRAVSCDLGPEAVYLAWELSRCVAGLDAAAERVLEVLVLATIAGQRAGSTRLPIAPLGGETRDLLERLGGPGSAAAAAGLVADPRLGPILGRPGDYQPLILDGGAVYHQRLHAAEARLVDGLRARLGRAPRRWPAAEMAAALAGLRASPPRLGVDEVELSEEQQLAVLTALHAPLTVITGGPGTGKTSIVVSILRLFARLGTHPESIALAAPTGKAANRLGETIRWSLRSIATPDPLDERIAAGAMPRTLHRLLGFSPRADRFHHHENNRLAEAVVIVDECSMIDLALMDQLVRAVRDDAQLVLLGDAEQLPSVEAGAVFRDLAPPLAATAEMPWRTLVRPGRTGRLPPAVAPAAVAPLWRTAVRLTHSYRLDPGGAAGAPLLEVARAVNEGRSEDLVAPGDAPAPGPIALRATVKDVAFVAVEWLADESGALLAPFLARWFHDHVAALEDYEPLLRHTYQHGRAGFGAEDGRRLARLLAHHDRHRVLCVTRGAGRPTGAAAVNQVLHAHLCERLGWDGLAEVEPGDAIMVQQNDYERNLYNGDQGLVLWVREPGGRTRPMAVFRRGAEVAAFPLDALSGSLAHSFAMTVHKAQGSEFERVALVLPADDIPLLTREVLYTALTRSRAGVVIVGRRGILEAGVRRQGVRSSGVAEKLAGGAPVGSARP